MSLSRRLESCSLERITKMKDVVMQEIDGIDRQLVEKEKELDEMIETVETVSLSKRHGQYELSLDKAESQISRLNDEKEKLLDKVRIIEQARQKKHLMDEQARVLGSVARVRVKDLDHLFSHSFSDHNFGRRLSWHRSHRYRCHCKSRSSRRQNTSNKRFERGPRVRAGEHSHSGCGWIWCSCFWTGS